jgi:ketosteroid isomerase-like protein
MEGETMASPFAQQIEKWQGYANQGDAKSIKNLYASNAVALFTEGPIITGQDAIAADLQNHFGTGSPYTNLKLQEQAYGQQGNWGWSYGSWNTGNDPKDPSGSWSVFWMQQNNNWLIQIHSVVPYIPGS